jgi:hypothetical protein
MTPPEPVVPETRERRCSACDSERIEPMRYVLAVDGLIKVLVQVGRRTERAGTRPNALPRLPAHDRPSLSATQSPIDTVSIRHQPPATDPPSARFARAAAIPDLRAMAACSERSNPEDIDMSKPVQIARALTLLSAALTLICAVAAPVWATKRCPPVTMQNSGGECKVVNYSTTADLNVTITLYDRGGAVLKTCGPTSIPEKGQDFCIFSTGAPIADVGCEVTGEGSLARVSLVTYVPGTTHTGAAVECR